MSHISEDVARRTSLRIREVIPDFIENDYPQFVEFIEAYYRFLEQSDNKPINAPFVPQPGVVTVRADNSTIVGGNTAFIGDDPESPILQEYTRIRVGSEIFTVQSVISDTELLVFEVPKRSYFASIYSAQLDPSGRQASGALRQLLTYHDLQHTLDEFLVYYRDTYLRDVPYGYVDTETMIERVLDFYQARGSEDAFRFLFRTILNKSVEISFPREQVFRASDGQYEIPTIIKLSRDSFVGDPLDLETRYIIGLQSGAIATVLRVTEAYEGEISVITAFIDDVRPRIVEGNLLLDTDVAGDDTSRLIMTAYGTPPEGSTTQLYDWEISLEDSIGATFIPGETISTLPSNDPVAITAELLGTVIGFDIVDGGSGYAAGDLIYPPTDVANGFGIGAIGRIAGFSNTDIDGFIIDNPGERYYAGLTLIVDSSGTGGSGLAGAVSAVRPGRVVQEDEDYLQTEDGFLLSREDINYFEEGVRLLDALTSVSVTPQQGTAINSGDWSNSNALSALYNVGLQTRIIEILSQLSVVPVYVNTQRVNLGEIDAITVTSSGVGYVLEPTVSVQAPETPSRDPLVSNSVTLVTQAQMPFIQAEVSAEPVSGQVGYIEVISGGSGYTNTSSFMVGPLQTSSVTGSGLEVRLALGAINQGQGRFADTRGQVSSDRYIQDITYYQPFSYVLTVEDDVRNYRDVVNRFVHPAGGLMIPRQTITSVLSFRANVYMEVSRQEIVLVDAAPVLSLTPSDVESLATRTANANVAVLVVNTMAATAVSDIELSLDTAPIEAIAPPSGAFLAGSVSRLADTGVVTVSVPSASFNNMLTLSPAAGDVDAVAPEALRDVDTYVTVQIMDGSTVIRTETVLATTANTWLEFDLTEGERSAITAWPPEIIISKNGMTASALEVEFIHPG